MASGSGSGSDGANPLWMVIWFLLLIFIGFPVAGFCAGWYILIMPFTVCIEGLTVRACQVARQHLVDCLSFVLMFPRVSGCPGSQFDRIFWARKMAPILARKSSKSWQEKRSHKWPEKQTKKFPSLLNCQPATLLDQWNFNNTTIAFLT